MKKIVLVIKDAYSYAGTENICNFMSECFGENHDVTIYSIQGGDKPFYPFTCVTKIESFHRENNPIRAIARRIHQEQFEAIFIISMGRLSVMFALHSLLMRRSKKGRFYACEHIAINSFNRAVRLLKFLTLHFYDKVIVLTDKDHRQFTSWKINSLTIPNPVRFKNYERCYRTRQMLAVGRLDHQKGFDLMLPIWQDFVSKNPGWTLVIAGKGEQRHALEGQVRKLKISGSVMLTGKVTNIDDYYRDSDIVLMTSRYEGLPLVLLEAKSWSLPVIAYDCPTGPREIITPGEDGFLIAPNDQQHFVAKLNQLARDDALFYTMCRKTRTTCQRFDESVIKQAWLSLV